MVAVAARRDFAAAFAGVAKLYASVWMEGGSPLMVYAASNSRRWRNVYRRRPWRWDELRLAITGKRRR